MPSKSKEDWAYAAGLFDGEGHISIAVRKANLRRDSKEKLVGYERVQFQLSMAQNNQRPLIWLRENFGGSIKFVTGKKSYCDDSYTRWNWVLSKVPAREFLCGVLPYLKVRQEEALLALEFCALYDGNTRAKVSESDKLLRASYATKIKEVRNAVKVATSGPVLCDVSS